ncbi:protein phosphatase CheZ [Roseospirillum parvum]|uniref:Chemotaxis protein CheZ n=1 Tax=Roseospirillum parvum TaxID=83401 RepID=A0A1G8FGP4_9PROT|nr:protein phosphatase CheZ [Roseospirillum parvum]SDH81252.1 chemotaxis protein CheZ [Roseospirillum parvum]
MSDHPDSAQMDPAAGREQLDRTAMARLIDRQKDILEDLRQMASLLDAARSEIASLKPQEIGSNFLPSAADELDAIVEATEQATGQIMDSAEIIEAVVEKQGGEVAEQLTEAVTRIYEACSFQDITGQRITKVVRTLKSVEERVSEMLAALDLLSPDEEAALHAQTAARAGDPDEADLLNGPQLPDQAIRQDDVDALFGGPPREGGGDR